MAHVRRMLTTAASLAASLVLALGMAATLQAQTYPSKDDPRNGLKAGRLDGGVAAKGMKLISFTPKAAEFDTARGLTFANSDLAFGNGKYVYQGNFAGFTIWDVGNPGKPVKMSAISCITSQGDPSIIGNLLFVSAEGGGNRKDCGKGGVTDPKDHMAGVRIFDVKDPSKPKLVKNVETCKGSHTHTIVPSKTEKGVLYIYVSGSGGAREENDLPGCKSKANDDATDEANVMFRLDIIRVETARPERAEVVSGARIFTGLGAAPRAASRGAPGGGRGGRGGDPAAAPVAPPIPTGPRNCHDVTSYPAKNLLAGACGSYGILVDISNPVAPFRLDAVADTNFSLWHTAVFSDDGNKIVFTDEWGGGTSPMCQANSMMEMGGNTTLTITADKKLVQGAYFKINTQQTAQENCVSHNGGIVPVPGRDIMAQGWYQGGVDIIDFTDPKKPFEIGYFDRGPIDPLPGADIPIAAAAGGGRGGPARGAVGGSWGAYYWNGYVYSSEIDRGFDIFELTPSENLSANEIAAAKLVTMTQYNPQSQPKLEWPAAFPVVRSYLDQLVRNKGLDAARTTAIDAALTTAESQSGGARKKTLNDLALVVDKHALVARDGPRVKTMAAEIRRLAAAR